LFSDNKAVIIRNPIAQDMVSMRKSLIPSLIQTAVLNFNKQNRDIRIFEKGKIFRQESEIHEYEHLGILLSGKTHDRIWANPQREYDFFDIKGITEYLFDALNIGICRFTRIDIPHFMHPGKSARIIINDIICGIVGEIHPKILKKYDMKQNIFVAEINLETLFENFVKSSLSFARYSPYPAVDRDIAIVLSKDIPSETITDEIRKMNIGIVEEIYVFDLYEGKGIEEGRKSLGISIKYRSQESTLTDEEVDNTHSKIVDNLLKKFYANLR
ncbi:MAG: phenylalanine--tRNA ligase subunit beta, partial [Deltaproteobacteria bacterium]|nr:phenylalanine--tRNA ligase subunit beta [Deltaproteobacteria bacterium]